MVILLNNLIPSAQDLEVENFLAFFFIGEHFAPLFFYSITVSKFAIIFFNIFDIIIFDFLFLGTIFLFHYVFFFRVFRIFYIILVYIIDLLSPLDSRAIIN